MNHLFHKIYISYKTPFNSLSFLFSYLVAHIYFGFDNGFYHLSLSSQQSSYNRFSAFRLSSPYSALHNAIRVIFIKWKLEKKWKMENFAIPLKSQRLTITHSTQTLSPCLFSCWVPLSQREQHKRVSIVMELPNTLSSWVWSTNTYLLDFLFTSLNYFLKLFHLCKWFQSYRLAVPCRNKTPWGEGLFY